MGGWLASQAEIFFFCRLLEETTNAIIPPTTSKGTMEPKLPVKARVVIVVISIGIPIIPRQVKPMILPTLDCC
jgi:hypothetical protein